MSKLLPDSPRLLFRSGRREGRRGHGVFKLRIDFHFRELYTQDLTDTFREEMVLSLLSAAMHCM